MIEPGDFDTPFDDLQMDSGEAIVDLKLSDKAIVMYATIAQCLIVVLIVCDLVATLGMFIIIMWVVLS